jgi:hypothetical protein
MIPVRQASGIDAAMGLLASRTLVGSKVATLRKYCRPIGRAGRELLEGCFEVNMKALK